MNSIGLRTNLTFQNALISAQAIASRTWGYSQGWAGAEAIYQVDGSLVLGGYDAAQTMGKNLMPNPSLFSSSAVSDMQGCISSDYPLMSLS